MLDVITFGHETLQQKAEPVTKFDASLKALIAEMFDAMRHENGIGLAAPQVDKLLRIFITDVSGDKPRVFINPEIVQTSQEEVDFEEGCLSLPGLYVNVRRAEAVKIQAFNEKGRPFVLEASGMLARAIQHEYDHLNGVLFIERLQSEEARLKAINVYNTKHKPRSKKVS